MHTSPTSPTPHTGRHTAVTAACAALGVHLVSVDAHELLGPSVAKTCAAVRAVFEGAADVAPCVLEVMGARCCLVCGGVCCA